MFLLVEYLHPYSATSSLILPVNVFYLGRFFVCPRDDRLGYEDFSFGLEEYPDQV